MNFDRRPSRNMEERFVKARHVKARHASSPSSTAPAPAAALGVSRNTNVSGAPVSRPGRALVAFTALALCFTLLAVAGAQAATPDLSAVGFIGSSGEGPGQFSYSNGVAINDTPGDPHRGDIYALDPDNSRVEVFDSAGTFLFQFGTEGTGAGQLGKYSSAGISIDQSTGDLYVSEAVGPQSNNRVSKFDSSGNFILTFGKQVNQDTLGDVCTAASGDTCQAGQVGNGNGEFSQGLATVDPSTHNLVNEQDQVHRIQQFTPIGKFISSFSAPELETFIGIDDEGVLYTPGRGAAKTVYRYSNAGAALPDFGAPSVWAQFRPFYVVAGPGTAEPSKTNIFVEMEDRTTTQFQIGEFNKAGLLLARHAIGMPFADQLASDPAGGRILAALPPGNEGHVLIIGTPTTHPVATILPATAITVDGATVSGTVNPSGTALDTGYHFEYRSDDTQQWTPIPVPDSDVGNGTADVPVSETLSGLDPHTTYHVRLVATRQQGGGSGVSAETTFATASVPAQVSLVSASHVLDHSADLIALVNPEHSTTTYYFQYGTDSGYGTDVPADHLGQAGADLGNKPVSQGIDGLEPETLYHFRIVADNGSGPPVVSPDHTFTTRSTAEIQIPARGIELVNTPEKGNINIAGAYMDPIGEHVLWSTVGGGPQTQTAQGSPLLATRTASGWESQPVLPPASDLVGEGEYGYTLRTPVANMPHFDFSSYFFTTGDGLLLESDFVQTLVQVNSDRTQQVLYPLPPGSGEISVSQDGRHFYYATTKQIDPEHIPGTTQIYELSRPAGQQPPLIGRLPDGSVPTCGAELISAANYIEGTGATRVYFKSAGNECEGPENVYLRNITTQTTTLVTGPQAPLTEPAGDAAAYFTTTRALNASDSNLSADVYRWKEGSEDECLTCTLPEANVEDMLVSPDQSHVYFSSTTPLVPGAESFGTGSIYDLHSGQLDFVASGRETASGPLNINKGSEDPVAVSNDGKTLTFVSAHTTAEESGVSKACGHGGEPLPCRQVYHYDEVTGNTECISCPPPGVVPDKVGTSSTGEFQWAASPDGHTVAFITSATLLPEDINGTVDVYVWHNGTLRLVTDGDTESAEGFRTVLVFQVSNDGGDILFTAQQRITGREKDPLTNLYDARIGGGFPLQAPPAHCSEDACQGPLQPLPAVAVQGSSTFDGAGSPAVHRKGKRRHRGHHKHGSKGKRTHHGRAIRKLDGLSHSSKRAAKRAN